MLINLKKVFIINCFMVFTSGYSMEKSALKIALIGEYNGNSPSYQATNDAIEHSNKKIGTSVMAKWISPKDITIPLLNKYAGIWIAPGGPCEYIDKTLMAIQYARENKIPCLGTCGGFQHIIVEYARNVLGYKDAQHAEADPHAPNLFITPNTCSLSGKKMKVTFTPHSKIATIYDTHEGTENYYCNFSVNPKFSPLFANGTLQTSGSDTDNEI